MAGLGGGGSAVCTPIPNTAKNFQMHYHYTRIWFTFHLKKEYDSKKQVKVLYLYFYFLKLKKSSVIQYIAVMFIVKYLIGGVPLAP